MRRKGNYLPPLRVSQLVLPWPSRGTSPPTNTPSSPPGPRQRCGKCDMGRRTLVLLGLAGMSLCLVFSLPFRQAGPVPPTGTSERDSVVEGGEVFSLDQLVAAEDPYEEALSRVPVHPDYVLANGAVRQTRIEIGGRTTILEALTRIELTETADLSAVTVLRPDRLTC